MRFFVQSLLALSLALALPSVSLTLAGCSGDSGDEDEEEEEEDTNGGDTDDTNNNNGGGTFEDFCGELDECNLLSGMSASECVDSFETCTDELLASEAADVEAAMEECLAEADSCSALEDCYWNDVPYC